MGNLLIFKEPSQYTVPEFRAIRELIEREYSIELPAFVGYFVLVRAVLSFRTDEIENVTRAVAFKH